MDSEFMDAIRQIAEDGPKPTAAEWLNRTEEENGAVPLIYQKLDESPEALLSLILYKRSVMRIGALSPKTVELLCIGIGSALRCDHCTAYHIGVAQKLGATKQEILETILIAGLLSNSSVLANAYRIVDSGNETDRCDSGCDIR